MKPSKPWKTVKLLVAGHNGITAENYKIGGHLFHYQLHQFIKIWINEVFRHTVIITIYKRKANRFQCKNYYGISLLATAGKILSRIINNKLEALAMKILQETKDHFRHHVEYSMWILHQLQKKTAVNNVNFCMTFIDLAKLFDSIWREILWNALSILLMFCKIHFASWDSSMMTCLPARV